MNYELAKKLKEAGFPERPRDDGDFTLCQHDNGELHDRDKTCEVIVIPTLSQLIEACGERFSGMQKSEHYFDAWSTSDFRKKTVKIFTTGSTPEIAVANLWLELNKK